MASPTEIYVDPSLASSSGSGTIGSPYGDLQHALNTVTRDATNGDRFNIKAGTDEILSAALDFTTYGTPTDTAPVILQGYTTTAGDGGIGGISGNGSVSVISSGALDFVILKDLHCHNCGANTIINLDNNITIDNCEFDNTTGDGINIDNNCSVTHCNIYNIGAIGLQIDGNGKVTDNYFKNATNSFTSAVRCTSVGAGGTMIDRNYFTLDGSTIAIDIDNDSCNVEHNSILSSAGTGSGIDIAVGMDNCRVTSNIIEGFSGAGGKGITWNSTTTKHHIYDNNSVYNCTTAFDSEGDSTWLLGGTNNETLGSSPFSKSGSNTYALRETYFNPLDVGSIYGGAY